jgi:hypothetical protein
VPSFRLDEHREFAAWLDKGLRKSVNAGLLGAAHRVVEDIQTRVIPEENPQPVFDVHYRNAWHAEPQDGGADVVNDMPYAPVIEYGADAKNVKIGRAMIEALAEWARRKGLTGHAPGKRSSPEARADARKIAWAIARRMQGTADKPGTGIFNRHGQKGLRIAEKGLKRLPEFVRAEVADAIRRHFG